MNGNDPDSSHVDYRRLTTRVISAYVSHNHVAASDVPSLIASMHAAIAGLQAAGPSTADGDGDGDRKATPAQIRSSVMHEALISFEDGKRYKTIKRHLTACGLTPETYRAKWGLPSDYPMVAPAYAEKRSKIAKGLAKQRYQPDRAPESAAA